MSQLKWIERIIINYSAKGRNFVKGDHLGNDVLYSIRTNDNREVVTDRTGIISMLADVVAGSFKNVTSSRLISLIGKDLKESAVLEELKPSPQK